MVILIKGIIKITRNNMRNLILIKQLKNRRNECIKAVVYPIIMFIVILLTMFLGGQTYPY